MTLCVLNGGYVRNAGVCLHACTCVFVCQHIVPASLPLWRYKAIVELSGDDKAAPGKAHFLKDATNWNSKARMWQRLFEKFCTQARAKTIFSANIYLILSAAVLKCMQVMHIV